MNIIISDQLITFKSGDKTAGIYVLDDPFKPYFKVVNTPKGHNLTCVSPVDHRHHKGLMYALRCKDLNFWEEDPNSNGCGVQEILSTKKIHSGFTQELLWKEINGNLPTYKELRTVTCEDNGSHFEWTFTTQRTSLRDHLLIMSEWSIELEPGRKVNYHGLGVRLPWAWCWGGPDGDPNFFGSVELDGQPVSQGEALGSTARSAGFSGRIDGYWDPPIAALTITQDQGYGWFALREGFPYLAVGPSILEEVEVAEGETYTETYKIKVEDR